MYTCRVLGEGTHLLFAKTWPSKWVVLESPDRICFIRNVKLSGVSKNGKPWSRWTSEDEISFSLRRAGRLNVYLKAYETQRDKPGHRYRRKIFRNVSPYVATLYLPNGWQEPVSKLLGAEIETRNDIFDYMYPIAAKLGVYSWGRDQGRHFRSDDFVKFMRKTLGEYYRKDLVKALATSKARGKFDGTKSLLGLIPVDWIVEKLRTADENEIFPFIYNVSDSKRMFDHMTRPQLRRVFMGSAGRLMIDAIRVFNYCYDKDPDAAVAELKGLQTWSDIHGKMSKLSWRLANKNEPIEQVPLAKSIGLKEHSVYEFRPARETDDIMQWSEVMHNCIRGYKDEAVAGRVVLVGVYKQNELFANLEITPAGKLKQILGKYNNHLPIQDQRAIVEALDEEIIEFQGAWGWDGGDVWLQEHQLANV